LSIDIGSAPAKGDQVYQQGVIPVKPIANFCANYRELQDTWRNRNMTESNESNHDNGNDNGVVDKDKEYRICVVGGGAGGIELALSVQYNLLQTRQADKLQVMLVTSGKTLLNSHNARVRRKFERVLAERNVKVYYQARVQRVQHCTSGRKELVLTKESQSTGMHPDPIVVDDCLWCVTAGVSSWLAQDTPFATTEAGFLRVNDTYESIHHPGVFAAGDCCHMDKHPRPKGMYCTV
jgi:selenide,water dikinase